MKRTLLIFLTLWSVQLHAQVTLEAFLYAAVEDPALKALQTQTTYLTDKSVYRLPPIQKLELRTESNQLDRTRQDYGLRINPANPFEVRRTTHYFETYQQLLQLDQARTLKELLYHRYKIIIDYACEHELLALRQEDKQTTENLLAVHSSQRLTSRFDAEEYIETKLDYVDKTLRVEETLFDVENKKRNVEALLEGARVKTIDWRMNNLLSLPRMEQVVDSLHAINSPAGEVAYREKKIALAKDAWQLEKVSYNIGFVQAQYQQWRIEQNRRPWSISLGVALPLFNDNKGDIAKRKLQLLEAEGDYSNVKRGWTSTYDINYERVKSLLVRCRDVQAMMKSLQIETTSGTLLQMSSENPVLIMRVQGNLTKLKILEARLFQEVYNSYLEFLFHAEVLQQRPLRNFLAAHLPVITP